MRMFVPEQFKGPGNYWARQGTSAQRKRRKARLKRIYSEAKPGNTHFLIFPSSTAKRTVLDPANATVGPSLSPSAAETPSEQVKKVGGDHVNQHPDDHINRSPMVGAAQSVLQAGGSGGVSPRTVATSPIA